MPRSVKFTDQAARHFLSCLQKSLEVAWSRPAPLRPVVAHLDEDLACRLLRLGAGHRTARLWAANSDLLHRRVLALSREGIGCVNRRQNVGSGWDGDMADRNGTRTAAPGIVASRLLQRIFSREKPHSPLMQRTHWRRECPYNQCSRLCPGVPNCQQTLAMRHGQHPPLFPLASHQPAAILGRILGTAAWQAS